MKEEDSVKKKSPPVLLLFETTPHKKTSLSLSEHKEDFVVMSARKVGSIFQDDDASLSVSGVARSVFSVFVSPSDDDEKDDDDVEVGDTHCVR